MHDIPTKTKHLSQSCPDFFDDHSIVSSYNNNSTATPTTKLCHFFSSSRTNSDPLCLFPSESATECFPNGSDNFVEVTFPPNGVEEDSPISPAIIQPSEEEQDTDEEEKLLESNSGELPPIAEDADDTGGAPSSYWQMSGEYSSEFCNETDIRESVSFPERLKGGASEEEELLSLSADQEEKYKNDWNALIREKRGRSMTEDDGSSAEALKTKCRSQIIAPLSLQVSSGHPEETTGLLDRTMSHSTPSIDSTGQDQELKAKEGPSGKSPHSKSGKVPSKPRKPGSTGGSSLPPWAMMTPRPMTVATTTKSTRAGRSHSTVSAQDSENKEKPKRSANSFLSRIGMTRTSTRGKTDKKRPSKAHFFIPASISNGGECEVCKKPLAKSFTAASQCDRCEITVHENCKKEAGHCIKWTKHPHQPITKQKSDGHTPSARPANPENGDGSPGHVNASGLENGDQGDTGESDEEETVPSLRPDRSFPPLILPEWEELRLWQSEPEVWSVAYKQMAKKLSDKEVKKQDVIHELYITEKHHCETLVMLKQTYRKMLEEKEILNEEELERLLPGVLDHLFHFHSKFLTLLQYKKEEVQVNSVQDILTQHFTGQEAGAAVEAYAMFCSAKESANDFYKELIQSRSQFRLLMEHVTRFPLYKDHSLQDCLLLVTQRLTKYSVLVDAICKRTDSKEVAEMKTAVANVKAFIARVDQGVQKLELRKHWEDVQKKLEDHSQTTLHNNPFTAQDLLVGERELLCTGNVQWQNAARKPAAVKMLLFTDLIVFLQTNGSKYWLFSQDNHEAVMSVRKLLVRERAGRPPGIFLISTGKKPDMYEILCQTKNDLARWLRVLNHAVKNCADSDRLYAGADRECQESKTTALKKEMEKIFESKLNGEEKLKDYFETQIAWYKTTKGTLEKLCTGANKDVRDRVVDFLAEEFDKISVQQDTYIREYIQASEELLRGSLYEVARKSRNDGRSVPRRVFTFNGLGDRKKGTATVRRNTTVPKLETDYGVIPDERRKENDTGDAEKSVLSSEEVVESWMKELSFLKHKNETLEKELALKRAEGVLTYSETQQHVALEKLRDAQSDLQTQQREFQKEKEERTAKLDDREAELNHKKIELDRQETEVRNMWKAWEKHIQKQLPGASDQFLMEVPEQGGRGGVVLSASTSDLERRASQPLLASESTDSRRPIAPEDGVIPSRSVGGSGRSRPPEHMQYSFLNQPKDGGLPKQQIPKNLLPTSLSEANLKSNGNRRQSSSPNRNGGKIGSLFRLQDPQPQQILPSKLKEPLSGGKKKKK